MRKNGINRTLTPIAGGVCAPKGFSVSATRVGLCEGDAQAEDLALLVTKRRFPSAFVGTNCTQVGAHVRLSEKHILRLGLASAVLIIGGAANRYGDKADELAENISRLFARKCNIDRNQMLLVSTGRWDEPLDISLLERGIPEIVKGFTDTEEGSLAASRALSLQGSGGQCAFTFWLGDTPCKIGAIYSGALSNDRVAQSVHCVLTSDIKIEPKALQKALKSVVSEHFYMLSDHIPSPNDCVCMLTSGEAENWDITEENSDYPKFLYALHGVLSYICKRIASETDDQRLLCKVVGARSKNAARSIAKAFASSPRIKRSLSARRFDVQELLSLLMSSEETIRLNRVSLWIKTGEGEVLAYEDERTIPLPKETLEKTFGSGETELIIDLKSGNYAATGYGRL